MDLLAELESMAINVTEDRSISDVDIERWQQLFALTSSEAVSVLERYRLDLSRIRVTDEHWDAVKLEKEAEGFDREAYEYSLTRPPKCDLSPRDEGRGMFIVQLDGPLNTPEKIQEAAKLNNVPVLLCGMGENGQAQFCEVDGTAKARLLSWLSEHHPSFKPIIVRLSKARKELCTQTLAPMLGKDFTFPQNRADSADFEPTPAPNQYPVWYFFYGTLADPADLSQHLGLDEAPSYVPAYVIGGQIRIWARKYKALIDAAGEIVHGSAFLVQSRAHEEALRFYETEKYEVVRCQIFTESEVMNGLTFRFAGSVRDLD